VRFLDGEKAEVIAKVIHSLSDGGGAWLYVQFALGQPMARQ
jgi:hypothetical protein